MARKIFLYIAILILTGYCGDTFCQVKISGPECVIPGTEYQYDLYATSSKIDSIDLCVDGGYLTANRNTCYSGVAVNSIRITWNDSITKGQISITTSRGKVSLNVRPTKPLQGGKVDTLLAIQALAPSVIPNAIICTAAKGGSCSPSYAYQWEQSDDNLHWTEVDSAIDPNFTFSAAPAHTVFLRRRILEQASNTIAYSNVAIIVVIDQQGTN
jgi:hypothetical protein